MWIHRVCGTLMLILTITLGVNGIRMAGWTVKVHFHNIMGIIILSCVSISVTLGFITQTLLAKLKW